MELKTIRKRKPFENVRGKGTHSNQAPRPRRFLCVMLRVE